MAARRMDLVSFLCCLLAMLCSSCGKEFVPAYMWQSWNPSDAETPPLALKKYSTDDFVDVLLHRLSECSQKPQVVFFTEENLSLEDFRCKFPNMQNVSSTNNVFIPNVEAPLRAVRGLETQGYKWRIEKLDDAKIEEDRPEFLMRHDVQVGETYSRLARQGPVLAVYTGRYASWTAPEAPHRVRRLLADTSGGNSSAMVLSTATILMYAETKPVLNESGRILYLDFMQPTSKSRTSCQILNAKFTTNGTEQGTVEFSFCNKTSGYWSLVNISYFYVSLHKDRFNLTATQDIVAAVGFSYHCTADTVFRNVNGTSLTFKNFQAQAFMQKPKVFGDAYNCEMFFTAPIWSGLFVTLLLGLIMIWGLVMIMDIRTMDQFDDPKGKTITISATE